MQRLSGPRDGRDDQGAQVTGYKLQASIRRFDELHAKVLRIEC